MSKSRSIAEIKETLATVTEPNDPFLAELRLDSRKGVQTQLKRWQGQYEKMQNSIHHHALMLTYEKELQQEGFQMIAGIDEVGRGPLAGPVVAAAVILPEDMPTLPINDSKKLSKKVRDELYDIIMEKADVGIGIVDNQEIDVLNIYQATKKAMITAIENLTGKPDALLIDAMQLALPLKQVSLIKGDARSYSIAAASIIAKVYRDRLMEKYAIQYPNYGFENNSGYGTKVHLEGLEDCGYTPIHRQSFEPIKTMVKNKFK